MKKSTSALLAAFAALALAACSGEAEETETPNTPTDVSVVPGDEAGTAVVSFKPNASSYSRAARRYTVTVEPGGITATGTESPITVTGLAARTAYTYRVVATNEAGTSAPAATGALRFYEVVETFEEPMTGPNDTIFTGSFTLDTTNGVVSNLVGSLTQAMTKHDGAFGPPMTTVALAHQLSSEPETLGGVEGLLVTTFRLDTTNVFDPGGFAPGGTEYYGLAAGAPNPKMGGVGNAYAMIFVNPDAPTAALAQAQLDKLAYGDCTAGGMMMSTCMTGTTEAGYGQVGTMDGYPASQVITER